MADLTPALARATETLIDRSDAYDPDEVVARKVVSAALRDPDGEIARQVAERIEADVRLLCERSAVHPGIRDSLAATAVDAVRAAVLGSGDAVGVDAAPHGL